MKISTIALVLVLAASGTNAAFADTKEHGEPQSKLLPQAKITEAQARETALTSVFKGKMKSLELEKEHGLLIWSIDLTTPATTDITEVQVNARTGAVVAIQHESPEDKKKEEDADKASSKAERRISNV